MWVSKKGYKVRGSFGFEWVWGRLLNAESRATEMPRADAGDVLELGSY